MTKRYVFRKAKLGEPILVAAQQLERFMLDHNSKLNSRDHNKFERMELAESPDQAHSCAVR